MPVHPAAAPETEPQPSHLVIAQQISELRGEMVGRFNGLDREVAGIRGGQSDMLERIVRLEGPRPALPPQISPRSERGLKWWAGMIAAVIAILGGLGAALQTAVAVAIACYAAVTRVPPHP